MSYYYLTTKEDQILQLIQAFRFLTRVQIQTILKHKDKKRINSWLKKLTDEEYLGRIYSNKLPEKNKPAIYYLHHRGILYLKNRHYATAVKLKKYYQDKQRSEQFINHCLLIGDLYLHILNDPPLVKSPANQATPKPLSTSQFLTRSQLSSLPVLTPLQPTIYWQRKNSHKIRDYLIEVIGEEWPRFAIRSRLRAYLEFYDSKEWTEATAAPFPFILLICPTPKIQQFVLRFTAKLLDNPFIDSGLIITVTTVEDIITQGFYADIWEHVTVP